MQVLVLEASTSSAKAMVYDADKGVVNLVVQSYDRKVGDGAVQDTRAVYEKLMEAGRQAAEGFEIAAIANSGIWHSLALCDKNMSPVTPTYTWAFLGAAEYAARLRADKAFTERFYHTTGCMAHAIYPVFRLAWLAENGLDIKDKYLVGQGSYNFYRLTGERLTTLSMASGSGFLNIHTLQYDDGILEFSGIHKNRLGTLCTHEETRPLAKEAAERLNLPVGIPVVPALSDGALNQVGSGALKPGVMTLSVGTSAAMRLAVDRPVIPDTPSTWCYYGAGRHLCGAAVSGATNCVDWYMRDILGGRLSYREIEDKVQIKEDAPYFMPFLFGERCPGWRDEVKGGFMDLTGHTGTADQYYAVLEGVLYNLLQCYEKLTEIAGIPKTVLVSGGICKSELWLSMLADIFKKEITLLSNEQASLLGGAVLALLAAGGIKNIEDFSLPVERVIQPDAKMESLYKKRYARYLELYTKL